MATKIKITESAAVSLQWRGTRYEAWDEVTPGFGIRVTGPKPHQRSYVVRAKRHGKQEFKTLGTVGQLKADKARELALAFRGAVRGGVDPRADEKAARNVWTLQDAYTYFAGNYAEARKLSVGYRADTARIFDNLTPTAWRPLKVTAISHEMIVKRHVEITNGRRIEHEGSRGGTTRANAWLRLMRKLFLLQPVKKQLRGEIPTEGIEFNPETARERYLSPRELAALWRYLEAHRNVEAAVLVQLILLTGCRSGEAYKMRWAEVDKTTGIWTKPLTNTKQKKIHRVSLTAEALRVLGKLDTWKRSEYVFPSPTDMTRPRDDKLKSFWRHTQINCALPGVRIHDLRHSFASWLAMRGVDLRAIGKQLGHQQVSTTARYAHFADAHLKAQAELMSSVIHQALEATDPEQDVLMGEIRKDGVIVENCGIQSYRDK